jgi:tetratricopeptide (TPR) repeat protein
MLSECPVAQLCDPKRALVLALRARELGHVGWGEVAVAQVAAGQYPEALETCEKASRAGQQTIHLTYCTALAYWHLGREAEARELVRQIVQQVGNQQNQYWYSAEYRWRARETAKLMGLEIEDLKSVNPEKALRNGIALYRRLAEDRPGDWRSLRELARRHVELYGLLSGQGRKEEAQGLAQDLVATVRLAVELRASLSAEADRVELGHSLWQLAGVLSSIGHSDDAEMALRRAVEVFDALAADFPENFFYRQEQGFANWHVGWLMNQLGRPLDAEEPFRRALAVYRQLAQDAPKTGEFHLRLGRGYGELLRLLWSAGRTDEAARLADDAIDTLSMAAREHGDVAASRDGLARFHHDYGILQRQSGQNQDALNSFQQAVAIWGKLADDVPGEPAYRLHQVNVLTGDLPPLLAVAGRVTELDEFAQGLTDLREFMKRHPDQPDGRRLALARAHLYWGAWQWRAARREEAHVTLDQATEVERDNWQILIERGNLWLILNEAARAIGDYSGALEHVQDAAARSLVCKQLGLAHSRLGRHAEARDDWQQAVDLTPNSAEANNNLAWLLATCPDAALRDPRRAVALAAKAAELQPSQGMYWNTLGAARYRAGDWAVAIEALNKSMELRQGGDAFDWFFLAMAEYQRGNKDEARRWYDKAREWTQRNAAANEELLRFEAEAREVMEGKGTEDRR